MDFSELDAFVQAELQRWGVPGLSLCVLQDGRLAYAQGYGLRDVERGLGATADTVYWVGSCTKAFTALAAGLLVDEGRLGWDTPVRDVLAGFTLRDTVASERLTVRDLLCHRSGLARHDRVWYKSASSRADLARRMAHLDPSLDFRAGYQYNNNLFIVAGAVIEAASGRSWEEFVSARILAPLGMTDTGFAIAQADRDGRAAQPYRDVHGARQRIPFYAPGPSLLGPAGALQSTALDMARWITAQLAWGEFEGRRVFPESILRETRTPHVPVNDDGPEEFGYSAYGLGWRIAHYRGRMVHAHGGLIDGFGTHLSLMPQAGLGLCVLTNIDATNMAQVTALRIYDLLMGLPTLPWSERFSEKQRQAEVEVAAARAKTIAARIPNAPPTRSLDAYCGTFHHPGYGDLVITRAADGALSLAYNTLTCALDHLHFDVFEFGHPLIDDVYTAIFVGDREGALGAVEIPWQPGAAPVRFARLPPG